MDEILIDPEELFEDDDCEDLDDEDWDWDVCYECGGYGDDWSFDDDGNPVCNCDTCPFNGSDD